MSDDKYIGKDVFGNQVFFAESDKTNAVSAHIDKLLLAVGEFMGAPGDAAGWAAECWVSDMSTLGDFGLEDDEVRQIGEKVGVAINNEDYLYEIAERMARVSRVGK